MNDLGRELAPVPEPAWAAIEAEARRALGLSLAARKLVEVEGPHGWEFAALNLGRVERLEDPPWVRVEARLRQVQPLVELRVPFEIPREEIDAISRGADAPDLQAVLGAAQLLAHAEDTAVFHGFAAAGIRGLCSHSEHKPVSLSEDYRLYPEAVTSATESLRQVGVDGPYALALGPRCYTGLKQTAGPGGFPILRHVTELVDGPVVWAPAVDGAAVLSLRGGDFQLVLGRDASIGYLGHGESLLRLYIEESFSFRLRGPEAAVPLVYSSV